MNMSKRRIAVLYRLSEDSANEMILEVVCDSFETADRYFRTWLYIDYFDSHPDQDPEWSLSVSDGKVDVWQTKNGNFQTYYISILQPLNKNDKWEG